MDVAYLSALAALGGSVVGGLTSGFATLLSQRAQARAGQLAREMSRRDDLYKEFIVAASKAYSDAILSNEPQVQELVALSIRELHELNEESGVGIDPLKDFSEAAREELQAFTSL
jgi:hypothetical protein